MMFFRLVEMGDMRLNGLKCTLWTAVGVTWLNIEEVVPDY